MVQKKYYTQSVDLWCLGVFLYEVIEGSTPFYNRERDRMYQRIERESVKFSSRFSESSKDLISKLLEKNPKYRYTLPQVKDHKFYENVDWVKVKNKEFWPKGVYTSKERKEVSSRKSYFEEGGEQGLRDWNCLCVLILLHRWPWRT